MNFPIIKNASLIALFSLFLSACGVGDDSTPTTNIAPIATSQTLSTNQDQDLNITLAGTDSDGSVESYAIVEQPVNGNLTGTVPNLIYTPLVGFNGTDSFSFGVTDDEGEASSAANIDITINALASGNQSPTVVSQSLNLQQNTSITIALTGADSDGTVTSYQVSDTPSFGVLRGILSGTGAEQIYTPNTDFVGTDSFTYRAVDNEGAISTLATIRLTIAASETGTTPTNTITTTVNVAPTAKTQSVTVGQNNSITITLVGTDTDGTVSSYQVSDSPTNGVLSGTGGELIYTPNIDFNGNDVFSFSVTDNDGAVSVEAAVTIEVVNALPTATTQSLTVKEDSSLTLTLAGEDSDGTVASYQIKSPPSFGDLRGVINGEGAVYTYTPDADFNGTDAFSFRAIDNDGELSEAAIVAISIDEVSDLTFASNPRIEEGDAASSTWLLKFTIDSVSTSSFDFSLNDGSATASDYNTATGTINFSGAPTTATLSIQLLGDRFVEADETLSLTLNNPANLQLPQITTIILTIANDDAGINQDTGILFGGDYPDGNNDDCNDETIVAQDCTYGRDAQAADTSTTFVKVGAGAAGFDFTKLGSDGTELAVQTAAYSATGSEADGTKWSCVRDNYTGLVWEVKTSGSTETSVVEYSDGTTQTLFVDVHHRDNTFRWGGQTAIGRDATAPTSNYYDDWNRLVEAANDDGLCGITDWRVPRIDVLASIVNLNETSPTIESDYFPTIEGNEYWTSSPDDSNDANAWSFSFDSDSDEITGRGNNYRVLLVSGADASNWGDNRYTVHADNTVLDRVTGLIWQRCSLGQTETDCGGGSANTYTWQEALQEAATYSYAGFRDWRLPNLKELRSIVDYESNNPSINGRIFPSTASNFYWSSSPYASENSNVWNISFFNGRDNSYSRSNNFRVRLVRGGQ